MKNDTILPNYLYLRSIKILQFKFCKSVTLQRFHILNSVCYIFISNGAAQNKYFGT